MINLLVALLFITTDATRSGVPAKAIEEVNSPIGISIGIDYTGAHTFFSTKIDTYVYMERPNVYRPFYAIYSIEGGVKYKMVSIGYYHDCKHPILSPGDAIEYPIFGGREYVYIKATIPMWR